MYLQSTIIRRILRAAKRGISVRVALHGIEEDRVVEIWATPIAHRGATRSTHFNLVVMCSGHMYHAISFEQVESVELLMRSATDIHEPRWALFMRYTGESYASAHRRYERVMASSAVQSVLAKRMRNMFKQDAHMFRARTGPSWPQPRTRHRRTQPPPLPHHRQPSAGRVWN